MQQIPIRRAYRIHMVNVTTIVPRHRSLHTAVRQQLAISNCVSAASISPFFEVTQLDAQDGALNAFQPVVIPFQRVIVLRLLSPVSESMDFRGEFVVVGRHCPTFAVGTQVFAGIKTETSEIPDAADAASLVFRAVSLRGIFDYG